MAHRNTHLVRWFTYQRWWFPIAISVYWRVSYPAKAVPFWGLKPHPWWAPGVPGEFLWDFKQWEPAGSLRPIIYTLPYIYNTLYTCTSYSYALCSVYIYIDLCVKIGYPNKTCGRIKIPLCFRPSKGLAWPTVARRGNSMVLNWENRHRKPVHWGWSTRTGFRWFVAELSEIGKCRRFDFMEHVV